MAEPMTRDQVLSEIDQIPEHHLSALYALIHDFKRRVEIDPDAKERIMQFAGSWAGMDEEEFAAFMTHIRQRRNRAFAGRRSHESFPG